jgi:hypothetical protein
VKRPQLNCLFLAKIRQNDMGFKTTHYRILGSVSVCFFCHIGNEEGRVQHSPKKKISSPS